MWARVPAPRTAVMVALGLLLLSFAIIPGSRAQGTSTVSADWCASVQGTWADSTSTCTLSLRLLVQSNATLIIPSGTTLVLAGMDIYGAISDTGDLFNNVGVLNDYGVLYVSGSLYNNATINIDSHGTVQNQGNLTNDRGGTVDDSGYINSGSGLGRSIHNDGTMRLESGSSLSIYGDFWNLGAVYSYGTIYNAGTFNNNNLFDNNAGFENAGSVDNTNVINNFGTWTNDCGSLLTTESSGAFNGNDPVTNQCTSTTTTTTSMPILDNSTEMPGQGQQNNSTDEGAFSSYEVPEFPYQALSAVALTVILVVAYLAVRSRNDGAGQ